MSRSYEFREIDLLEYLNLEKSSVNLMEAVEYPMLQYHPI